MKAGCEGIGKDVIPASKEIVDTTGAGDTFPGKNMFQFYCKPQLHQRK
jgi:sugar/nucleoside kinase (ribokinase family)